MSKTKVICFEGGELTGKTTAINNVKSLLEAKGKKVYISREPGGCEVAEEIRSVLLNNRENTRGIDSKVEELLFLAARRAHLLDVLVPLVESGEYDYILLDRFILSSAVYQGYANDNTHSDDRVYEMRRVYDLNMKYIRINSEEFMPDIFVILDMAPAAALKRARSDADRNRIDRKSLDYHELVRAGYRSVKWLDTPAVMYIDADQPESSITNMICRLMNEVL